MSGQARLFAASAAAMLASIAGAATVATFSYTNVESNPAGTAFSETVTATDPISNVRINASLTEVNIFTWGQEAVIEITAPDGQLLVVAPWAATFGFVGTLTATNLIENFPTQVPSAAGTWGINFVETFDDDDDGLADANWDSVSIAIESPEAPPACAPGLGSLTFTSVSSDVGAGAGGANSVVTGNFGVSGSVNQLVITGRYNAFAPSWRSESSIRITAPDGTIYNTVADAGAADSPGQQDVLGTTVLTDIEAGTGTWTFEFFETFVDAVSPDATWETVCFAANFTASSPTGTGLATPATVINDGSGVTLLTVTVAPGANPLSTGLGVTVNAAAIGAGTITLLDNGVAPDAVAGDNIFSANAAVANGTVAGSTPLPFAISDAQGRTGSGNIALTVENPLPVCPPGLGTPASFTGLISDDIPSAAGGVGNSIVTADFGIAGDINSVHITGRFTAFAPSWRFDVGVALTPPGAAGSFFLNFSDQFSPGTFEFIDTIINFAELQPGTGTWTIETYEDFEDDISPDAVWSFLCITGDQLNTTPFALINVVPGTIARDGVSTATVEVQVFPGQFPTSTGITVSLDDSALGGSGSLALLDDGNFPDVLAADGIYSGTITAAPSTPLALTILPVTVTDAELRTFTDDGFVTVVEAIGACCLTDGSCVVTSIGDCVDVQGGTFAGTGTSCGAPADMTSDGAGAFEDISATGALVPFADPDDSVFNVTLPFTFNFFGTDYTSGNISTNGNFQFGANNSASFANGAIPSAGVPNNALYVMWDDFNLFGGGSVYTELLGTIGVDARFIIQWNAGQYNGFNTAPSDLSVFQIALFEDGSFEYRYQTVSGEAGTAGAADTSTFGFEDATGTVAVTLAETRASLSVSAPISFRGNTAIIDSGVCAPACAPCAADYDNNGGVDGGDLAAFFNDFEQGLGCADVDQNGGVDGGDLAFFFSVFEAGGC